MWFHGERRHINNLVEPPEDHFSSRDDPSIRQHVNTSPVAFPRAMSDYGSSPGESGSLCHRLTGRPVTASISQQRISLG
jgi:hypothetical protein